MGWQGRSVRHVSNQRPRRLRKWKPTDTDPRESLRLLILRLRAMLAGMLINQCKLALAKGVTWATSVCVMSSWALSVALVLGTQGSTIGAWGSQEPLSGNVREFLCSQLSPVEGHGDLPSRLSSQYPGKVIPSPSPLYSNLHFLHSSSKGTSTIPSPNLLSCGSYVSVLSPMCPLCNRTLLSLALLCSTPWPPGSLNLLRCPVISPPNPRCHFVCVILTLPEYLCSDRILWKEQKGF